ncbi:MAG: aromatic ring-hydroxylating oxygenase subunit alpha [bacterium]|jgi:phenylpropionate dioxygenase-like ring-hydroxylating dioxygenase large terminal subunit
MAQAIGVRPVSELIRWPTEDLSRIPLHIYGDPEIYAWEQDRIFRGPTWNFLSLECEIPKPNDYVLTKVGDTPVIVVRTAEGGISALVNRCTHKGSVLCYDSRGQGKRSFVCPYHAWSFDQSGELRGIAFEKGVGGLGGMPEGFDKSKHALTRLRVEVIEGLVFGTFSDATPPLERYLGEPMVAHIRRTIRGRTMQIIGRYNHIMPNNWKLYIENSRDTHHPSLLHAFFATFKLNRLSAEGGIRHDPANWHHLVFAKRLTDQGHEEYSPGKLRTMKSDFGLNDPSLIAQWMEYDDNITNALQSILPGFVLQQILNSVGTRQIITRGTGECELIWTVVAFEEDTPEQRAIRIKQSNLVGPHGYISMEDGAIGGFVQQGIKGDRDKQAVVEMGGLTADGQPTRATETSVRGFYKAYRELMGS